MSIAALASFYGSVSRLGASAVSRSTASSNVASSQSTSSQTATTTVTISAEARQAASAADRITVPESIRQAALEQQNKVFPQDILDTAHARLKDNQGIGGSSSTPGLGKLPLLPENEALIEQIKDEMRAARAAGNGGMINLTPYAQLINAVQTEGWKTPMTREDAQKEVDIALAASRLSQPATEAPSTTAEAPLSEAEQQQKNQATMAQLKKELAGEIPDQWKQRWKQENLSMPKDVTTTAPQSMWLGLAKAAGISEDEFMTKARQLAQTSSGNTFLQSLESFISERFTNGTSGTQTSQTG